MCEDLIGRVTERMNIFFLFLQAFGSSTDSQISLGDKEDENSEDSDIHDDDKAMEELIANPIQVHTA